MKRYAGDLVISLCGLVTTVLTVGILVYVEIHLAFAFYSITHFFVLPTGAIISGAAAASGYYLGAQWLHARPTIKILFNMLLISVGAYFSINYLLYRLLEVDGVAVSTLVGFAEFMEVVVTNMSLTIGRGNAETGELGSLGYVVAVLQVIGFALGGGAVYLFLRSKPFCDHCNRYYRKIWRETRFTGDAEVYVDAVARMAARAGSDGIDAVREQHRAIGTEKGSGETHLKAELSLLRCGVCTRELLTFKTYREKGNDWEAVDPLSFSQHYAPKGETTSA